MRALYGQAAALPASLFELGISPHINASILISMLLCMPDIKVRANARGRGRGRVWWDRTGQGRCRNRSGRGPASKEQRTGYHHNRHESVEVSAWLDLLDSQFKLPAPSLLAPCRAGLGLFRG
jgi:hypothetical protein